MRRISLALALIGAVAATGCGQTSTSNTGGNRGVAENTFHVTVQNGQNGNTSLAITNGYVTSTPAGIDCGVAPHNTCEFDFVATTTTAGPPPVTTPNTVTLTATATGAVPFFGFAGDCTGPTCTLSGATNADRYILAQFGNIGGGHPNWSNPYVHVGNYLTDTFNCQNCHGPTLAGAGIAPSCSKCHAWPFGNGNIVDTFAGYTSPFTNTTADPQAWDDVVGGHFAAANTGHNSGECARCHTGAGFKDYIGADGSADNHLAGYTGAAPVTAAGVLDVTTTVANGFNCTQCHNGATVLGGGTLATVQLPQVSGNGITVTVDKVAAICGQCHTGARNGRNIAQLGFQLGAPTDWDAQLAVANNKVVRPHYLSALSTFLGEDAGVYAQIAGNNYTARNQHGGLTACTACHDPHTGRLPEDKDILAKCGGCHNDELTGLPVTTFAQLEDSRQFGFEGDIDGDGTAEPLNVEIAGLKAKLNTALQNYALNVGGKAICVAAGSSGLADSAYILVDSGVACGTAPNNGAYVNFTGRSLRAAFNIMAITNDPGAWAHNPRYAIEILYDTIADLNTGLIAKTQPTSPNGLRSFETHFGAGEAEDPSKYAAFVYHGTKQASGDYIALTGFTSDACYQCHGGQGGLEAYYSAMPAAEPAGTMNIAFNKVTGMQCSTCHALNGTDMKSLRTVATVYFPPQKGNPPVAAQNVKSFAGTDLPDSFAVCGSCHSGRENGSSIDIKIGSVLPGTFSLSFTNPHYLGAAGMILGGDAGVLYQYSGQTYAGKPVFWKTGTNGNAPGPYGSAHGAECQGCHQPKKSNLVAGHTFEVDFTYCATCHEAPHELAPIEEEFLVRQADLLTAIRAYVTANLAAVQTAVANPLLTNVCYYGPGASGQYWFQEISGVCQNGVANAPAAAVTFGKFDPKMLKAAYNYQWSVKEPGAWAHNEVYITEAMYDSIVDLSGVAPTWARP